MLIGLALTYFWIPTSPVLPSNGFPGIRLASAHVENRRGFDAKFIKALGRGGLGMADSFRMLHGGEHKRAYRSPGGPWGSSLVRADLVLLSSVMMSERCALVEAESLGEEDERGPSESFAVVCDTSNGETEHTGTQ